MSFLSKDADIEELPGWLESNIKHNEAILVGVNEDGSREPMIHHPHIVRIIGPFIGMVSTVIPFIILAIMSPISFGESTIDFGLWPLLAVPLGLAMFGYVWYERKRHFYVLTTEKFLERRGVVRRAVDPIHYHNTVNVKSQISPREMILRKLLGWKLGTIEVSTAGENQSDMVKEDVPKVDMYTKLIEANMDADSTRYGKRSQFEVLTFDEHGKAVFKKPDEVETGQEGRAQEQEVEGEDDDDDDLLSDAFFSPDIPEDETEEQSGESTGSETVQQEQVGTSNNGNNGDVASAMTQAAIEIGQPLSAIEYHQWRESQENPADYPDTDKILNVYGCWADACTSAGIESP